MLFVFEEVVFVVITTTTYICMDEKEPCLTKWRCWKLTRKWYSECGVHQPNVNEHTEFLCAIFVRSFPHLPFGIASWCKRCRCNPGNSALNYDILFLWCFMLTHPTLFHCKQILTSVWLLLWLSSRKWLWCLVRRVLYLIWLDKHNFQRGILLKWWSNRYGC